MLKSIKEFFVGKPKVEETVVINTDLANQATTVIVQPVVEEIKPETVTISISDNMNVSVSSQSDTVTLTPPVDSTAAWPFPIARPPEPAIKKKSTTAKRQEPVAEKKPVPTKAIKTKPRKKK